MIYLNISLKMIGGSCVAGPSDFFKALFCFLLGASWQTTASIDANSVPAVLRFPRKVLALDILSRISSLNSFDEIYV